jgi:hypothetical protein
MHKKFNPFNILKRLFSNSTMDTTAQQDVTVYLRRIRQRKTTSIALTYLRKVKGTVRRDVRRVENGLI